MSTDKPLVCLCCKKTYTMPASLVPPSVKPWDKYGICEACDTVVITGRLLNRVNEINQFIGDQFDVSEAAEISEVALPEPKFAPKAAKVRTPRKPKPAAAPPVKELPKVFTPAAEAQLSLFDLVTDMANALF
jgi:hypothetical protein